ncbi:hypothetical protein Tco_1043545 [Tanacetum coccineum]|uniref:Uncharacterized protein n=1 Tax=Tanacetum coccineum TaxID=301880 RepID=A0ABQ5GMD3_9ASTR
MPKATTTDVSLTKSYIPKYPKFLASPLLLPNSTNLLKTATFTKVMFQVTVQTDDYGYLAISFMIQHEFITLTLAQFGQILIISYKGQVIFTNEWDLASLEYSQETEGPYCTDLPTPDDILRLLELEQLYPHLDNCIYNVVERVMRLLALRQTRQPQSDRGKAHHSVSSTFTHHNLGSLSHQGDDDEDDGASHASTPSPTTYLNSLHPLNYQDHHMSSSS